MQTKSDAQLLREYAETRSEAAFAEIVSRHADLVYSAALRQAGSPDLAGDVAQGVFTALARKAPSLVRNANLCASLVGWLYRSTRLEALSLLRADRRRLMREMHAMQDFNVPNETSPDWEGIRPALDAAMAGLSDADRDAVLLRFFKNQDFRSVGVALGVGENAAQQRVIRALEKLRKSLVRQGITTTATALSIAISGHAVEAAPAGLVAAISSSAFVGGTTILTSTSTATVKTIAMTAIQKTLITATVVAAIGTGFYETRQASLLRGQVQMLQQQQEPLSGQILQLEQERDRAAKQLSFMADAAARKDADSANLLRLRSEVGMLRQRTNELGKLLHAGSTGAGSNTRNDVGDNLSGRTNFPRSAWVYSGFATPEDTLQSFMWAKSHGDVEAAFAAATPEFKQAVKDFYFKGKTDAEISGLLMDSAKNQTGIQILGKMTPADDEVIYQVHLTGESEKAYSLLTLKKTEAGWKVSYSEEHPDAS